MKEEKINFLSEYKVLCIKYKMEILGFDDGAFISELSEDQCELDCLAYESTHFGDGSSGMKGLHFVESNELKNSISDINVKVTN